MCPTMFKSSLLDDFVFLVGLVPPVSCCLFLPLMIVNVCYPGHAAQHVVEKHSRRLQCEVCNAHIAIVKANGAHLVTIVSSSGFVEMTLFGSSWVSHGLTRSHAVKRAKPKRIFWRKATSYKVSEHMSQKKNKHCRFYYQIRALRASQSVLCRGHEKMR
jgi:hypothetical protein